MTAAVQCLNPVVGRPRSIVKDGSNGRFSKSAAPDQAAAVAHTDQVGGTKMRGQRIQMLHLKPAVKRRTIILRGQFEEGLRGKKIGLRACRGRTVSGVWGKARGGRTGTRSVSLSMHMGFSGPSLKGVEGIRDRAIPAVEITTAEMTDCNSPARFCVRNSNGGGWCGDGQSYIVSASIQ